MIKKCVICGAEFKASPSDKKYTCSKSCSKKYKTIAFKGTKRQWSESAKERLRGKCTDNLKMGTPAAQKSPIAGSFETNQEAKSWTLKAPWGEVFNIRNLRLFFKNHPEYIPDNTPDQACKGIYVVKRSHQGKTPRPANSWKGWELLDWGE